MDCEKQLKIIRDAALNVKVNEVTILTGKNGSGKSVVRKLMRHSVVHQLNLPKDTSCLAATSMELRTATHPEWGGFSGIMRDNSDQPTGYETFKNITGLLKALSERPAFLVIDEPEIGMGEEMILSLCDFLNEKLKILPKDCYGVLIITHNRYLVEHLNGTFLNLEGMTKEEWLTREIIPLDLEQFKKDSDALFKEILKYEKRD